MNGTGQSKPGYAKIMFCAKQAKQDGIQYFWVDTCCIDKASSSELPEAINFMFRGFKEARKCYVYLSDVSLEGDRNNANPSKEMWRQESRQSRWFTGGWILQELLAPDVVEFFSREGKYLGDKFALEPLIHEITGIPSKAIVGSVHRVRYCLNGELLTCME